MGYNSIMAEDRVIKVTKIMVLGTVQYSPIDEGAKIFAELINSPLKTLNANHIILIKRLGYRVLVMSNEPTEL